MKEQPNNFGGRTFKMITWLASHPQIQNKLWVSDYDVDLEQCLDDFELLEKEGYYELIFILLMKNQCRPVIGDAIEKFLLETWAEKWEKLGDQAMIHELKERIRNEFANKESEKITGDNI